MLNSSRAILYAGEGEGKCWDGDFAAAARQAALDTRAAINACRVSVPVFREK
jgi:orotidine-5'-phosphate decarboxylase